ncbi:hypothetical protein RRG08_035908 [Elysia crispata]|uniref:Uncharacterized protein n=1 Tax=Elysia crispata TaxID=231223 RepID=A0AAE1A2A5_9GAST|nr:hypothetical protein RRG08_035908 [Elysia crispata]
MSSAASCSTQANLPSRPSESKDPCHLSLLPKNSKLKKQNKTRQNKKSGKKMKRLSCIAVDEGHFIGWRYPLHKRWPPTTGTMDQIWIRGKRSPNYEVCPSHRNSALAADKLRRQTHNDAEKGKLYIVRKSPKSVVSRSFACWTKPSIKCYTEHNIVS